ncbi:MAG: aminopeptidase [Prevotella sp.]|nr:aminopeptidase [Prevotella sp.]
MKNLLTLLLCLLWQATNAQVYEKGVSKALAEQRSQAIEKVRYDLTFDIPENQKAPVSGTAVISFMLQSKGEVVLDFQGKFSGACIVNGKKRVATMKNEHIIIPAKFTKRGLNEVEMDFVSLDKALNRQADYLYTLFVPDQARSCFPCFDQPDLRATFQTQLSVPTGWKTMVSNGQVPIPTYLYSFVAGRFEEQTAKREGYPMRVFYREQDPAKVKQLPKIMDEAGQALKWMEGYTGLKYPFDEFGMIILPGYQFSGMEHPGAIQLTDRRIFLGSHPSQDERMSRTELIAHETAHQWFGNIVALKWFEDVWTKEVLANFMAAKMTRRQFSKADHDLNFLKTYQARAMAFDRTEGTHPIAQKLGNLNHASLLYDDIIYYKAPVMMRILEDIMGPKELQAGLQKYLEKFYFKSASWDDLIETLDQQAPAAGVRQFSDVWVKEKGMPTIHTTYKDGQLVVSQTDPYGRGIFWRQKFDVRIIYDLDRSRTITVDMTQPTVAINLSLKPNSIIPNFDGRGYGRFTLDEAYTQKLPLRLIVTRNDLHRYALLLTLHDNYLMGRIPASYFGELYRDMTKEKNPLIMETVIDHMFKIAFDRKYTERQTLEQCIMDLLPENRTNDCRQTIIRKMGRNAISADVLSTIYTIWNEQRDPLFDEHDYMDMAYRLAITHPGQWQDIISLQRQRLKDDQLREEFDYVSRACNPDEQAQRQLFNSIVKAENRPHEPWALQTLQLLNADVREPQNNTYIASSLKQLEYLQQSSDIFFAANWLSALLGSHKSKDALQSVETFLKQHPNYEENLRGKILVASWPLKNIWQQHRGAADDRTPGSTPNNSKAPNKNRKTNNNKKTR